MMLRRLSSVGASDTDVLASPDAVIVKDALGWAGSRPACPGVPRKDEPLTNYLARALGDALGVVVLILVWVIGAAVCLAFWGGLIWLALSLLNHYGVI